MRKVEYMTGFKLPTNLAPKPNKHKYSTPIKVGGVLVSKVLTT